MAKRVLTAEEVEALGLEAPTAPRTTGKRKLSPEEATALGLEVPQAATDTNPGAGRVGGSFDLDGPAPRSAGASGSWGAPDLGVLSALAAKFNQGITKGGSDELVGLIGAARSHAAPGGYLKLPDGSEMPVPTREEMYRAFREAERQKLESAEHYWPKLGFAAEMGGELAGDVALAGKGAATRGYQTLSGLARGLLSSDADLTPSHMTPWTVGEAGLSSLFGGAVGNAAPVVASKVANSGVAKYLGNKADDALTYTGDKLKDFAGWLKVNSLHPTPTGAEAMAALPGGTVGVGRELLERRIGGITKAGTAKQAAAAFGKASAEIDELVKYHDAAGGPLVDVRGAIAAGRAKALELLDEPTTKNVGKQMMALVDDYEAKFANGTGSAEQILRMKRALGDLAYTQNELLKQTKDKIAGKLGEGLSVFERATDDALDKTLGPRFEAANLLSRQMRGAANASERTAARAQGNGLIPIKPLLALAATGGAGAVGGLPAAAAMAFGTKYGSQLGARTLYGAGSMLQSLPRAARLLAERSSVAPVAQEVMSSARGSTLGDLLELLNQSPSRQPLPAFAMDEQ